MAFVAGKSGIFLLAEEDLSGFFRSFDIAREANPMETTVFGDDDRTYIMGLRNGTLTVEGFFDAIADGPDAELAARLGQAAGSSVLAAPQGLTIGNRLYVLSAKGTRYTITAPVDGVVAVSADFQSDGGLDHGVSLHALSAETATGSGTNVDNLAATTNGGVAQLHLTTVTAVGGDTLDVIVQQSTTGAFTGEETTLATFTQLTTTKTSERVVVAAGTTVARYLRANWTKGGAGSPSYTFAVAFARR